eukprot:325803-Chlamydomonas_euryale.AAC.9
MHTRCELLLGHQRTWQRCHDLQPPPMPLGVWHLHHMAMQQVATNVARHAAGGAAIDATATTAAVSRALWQPARRKERVATERVAKHRCMDADLMGPPAEDLNRSKSARAAAATMAAGVVASMHAAAAAAAATAAVAGR